MKLIPFLRKRQLRLNTLIKTLPDDGIQITNGYRASYRISNAEEYFNKGAIAIRLCSIKSGYGDWGWSDYAYSYVLTIWIDKEFNILGTDTYAFYNSSHSDKMLRSKLSTWLDSNDFKYVKFRKPGLEDYVKTAFNSYAGKRIEMPDTFTFKYSKIQ